MFLKISILSAFILCTSVNYVESRQVADDHQFDILIFTQFWPVTICKEWKEKNPVHQCDMPKVHDSWSIHGVWPTRLGTKLPNFCNRTWQFDPEEVRPIEDDLINVWPNIEEQGAVYSLWAHEWNKHGTCAAILEPMNSQLKYFSQGLNWMQKYNMERILEKADIVPSDVKEYRIGEIHKAVVDALGVRPAIECQREHGRSYIVEIRICFNKTLELTHCDGIAGYTGNCDPSLGIYYIENPTPKSIYVQLYKAVSWLQWFTL